MIGNGWIAPTEHYLSYLPMAYKEGLLQGGSDVAKQLESQQAVCTTELNKPGGSDHVDLPQCEQILSDMLKLARPDDRDSTPCYNMYDIRLKDSYPSCGMNWPPDLKYVEPYLRRQEVIRALHVDEDKKTGWTECVGSVGSSFKAAKSKPSITLLPGLLEHMPIVLFSGDKDLICNHMGTEELIHNMAWNGGKGFELSPGTWAPRRDWTFENEPAGIYQEARNLTYILFYNSSHMVPFDYPRRTRDMLDRFLGVDIASIGGTPADSRIDGEKGLEVSVGGHPNSTVAQEKEKQKLKQARWDAYRRSGEVVLVIVIIAASLWGWFIWRERRRHRHHHDHQESRGRYQGLFPSFSSSSHRFGDDHPDRHHPHPRSAGLESFRRKRSGAGDVEAGDFDESELDDLHVPTPSSSPGHDDEDDAGDPMRAEGKGKGKMKDTTAHGGHTDKVVDDRERRRR